MPTVYPKAPTMGTLPMSNYTLTHLFFQVYEVKSSRSEYEVDLRSMSCTCRSYKIAQFHDLFGRKTCKHLDGLIALSREVWEDAQSRYEALEDRCFHALELHKKTGIYAEWAKDLSRATDFALALAEGKREQYSRIKHLVADALILAENEREVAA